jgi:hypothetical protein
MRSTFVVLVGILALGLLPAQAVAQGNAAKKGPGGMYNGQQIPRENIKESGTIKNLAAGKLFVLTEDGGQWLVNVEQNARELSYSASAEAAWLASGMFVEFQGTFNKKGEGTSPVSSLTVMVPSDKNPPGLHDDSNPTTAKLFAANEKEEEQTKGKKEETISRRVVGQITNLRGGKATVNAGGANVTVEIDEQAKVAVDLAGAAGLAFARPGDKVSFEGWYVQTYKGQAWANTISVTAAEKLTGQTPKKKPLPMATPKTPAEPKSPAEPKKPALDPLEVIK